MSTNDTTTRNDLARALRAVLPYAETRAEYMSDCAARVRDNAKAGLVHTQQAREAEEQRDRAWEAVNHAKALLSVRRMYANHWKPDEEQGERQEDANMPLDFKGIPFAWLMHLQECLEIDGGFTNPSAVAAQYAGGVRKMHGAGCTPEQAAVAISEAEAMTPDERIERYCHDRLPLRAAREAADRLKQMHKHPNLGGNAWEERALSQIFAAEGY
jgi:hypothetical protein